MTQPVALTGATGFIGGNLTRELASRGSQIRVLVRRPLPTSYFGPSVDLVYGDLHDDGALGRLVQGVGGVVHCAATVRGGSYGAFERVNVEGTRRLVRAAARQRKQPRLLLMSSVAAREPGLSWYSASKRDSERVLEEEADGMPWAVFRPTAVYGPGEREMQRLFRAMKSGLLPILGRLEGRISLLHVRDLVDAVARWLKSTLPVEGVFELQDGADGGYDWPEVAQIVEAAWGRPVRRIPVPGPLLYGLAALNLGLAKLTAGTPMLTPGKVRELRHSDWSCDNGPLTSALGWRPSLDLDAALRRQRAPEHAEA